MQTRAHLTLYGALRTNGNKFAWVTAAIRPTEFFNKAPTLCLLPLIFPIYHYYRCIRCIKVGKQTRIDPYAARVFVPATVGLKGRAVGKCSAAADRAKAVGYQFRIPVVSRVIICRTGQLKLSRLKVRPKHTALGTKRAGTAR